MIDKISRSPSAVLFVLLVVFCCVCGLTQFILLWPEPLATRDILAAMLKPDDSPLLQGANYLPVSECDRFLVLAEDLRGGLLGCHQVQLTRADIERQYLNAAWEYNSAERALAAAQKASAPPQLDNVEMRVTEAPQLGSFSLATEARVPSTMGDTYIQTIFWSHKNIFFRLSVVGRELTSFQELYDLAALVESRAP